MHILSRKTLEILIASFCNNYLYSTPRGKNPYLKLKPCEGWLIYPIDIHEKPFARLTLSEMTGRKTGESMYCLLTNRFYGSQKNCISAYR